MIPPEPAASAGSFAYGWRDAPRDRHEETAIALTNESCGAGVEGTVIPVDIAAAKAVAIARPVSETEHVPLIEATGRVLARDVRAQIDLPPFDNSAMDGYAVRIADFTGARSLGAIGWWQDRGRRRLRRKGSPSE